MALPDNDGFAAECGIPDALPDRPHPLLLLRANVLGIRAETIAIAHPKVAAGPSAGFSAEMPKKLGRGTWAMRHDRQLIALAKTHSLQDIADRLGRPITTIVRRAARLGVSIEGKVTATTTAA